MNENQGAPQDIPQVNAPINDLHSIVCVSFRDFGRMDAAFSGIAALRAEVQRPILANLVFCIPGNAQSGGWSSGCLDTLKNQISHMRCSYSFRGFSHIDQLFWCNRMDAFVPLNGRSSSLVSL